MWRWILIPLGVAMAAMVLFWTRWDIVRYVKIKRIGNRDASRGVPAAGRKAYLQA